MNKKIVVIFLFAIFLFLVIYLFSMNKKESVIEKIVINNPIIDLEIGTEELINASVVNNADALIQFESSDDSIVTVSNDGIVRALKKGNVIIIVSATSKKGEKLTAECQVSTFEGKKMVVDSVSFKGENLLMQKGNTYLLDYVIIPSEVNYEKEFKSSDENIVMVSKDGLLTAKEKGTATITLTINDSISASLRVFITDKNVETMYTTIPENISVLEPSITIYEGEEKELKYQVSPDNVPSSLISFYVADESVINVHGGKVKGLKAGNSLIIIESVNNIKGMINVSVKSKNVEATSINIISEKEVNVNIGHTSQIVYTIEPIDAIDKNVTFQSANPSVATVSPTGLITPVHTGETSIIVTLNNGRAQAFIKVKVSVDSNYNGKSGVNKSCNTSYPEDSYFNSCFSNSKNLIVSQSTVTIPAGGSASVTVKLPNCGTFLRYTRKSADGSSGWSNYVSQSRSNESSSGFTWIITAKPGTKGKTLLVSQTIQYDSQAPSGTCVGNVKSMKTITVKIT